LVWQSLFIIFVDGKISTGKFAGKVAKGGTRVQFDVGKFTVTFRKLEIGKWNCQLVSFSDLVGFKTFF